MDEHSIPPVVPPPAAAAPPVQQMPQQEHAGFQSEIVGINQAIQNNQDAQDETRRVMSKVVGFFPNTDKADNKLQAKGILIGMGLGVLVFGIWHPSGEPVGDLLMGLLAGLIIGALITGCIVMVRGLAGK